MTPSATEVLAILEANRFGVVAADAHPWSPEVKYDEVAGVFFLRHGELGYGPDVLTRATGCLEVRIPREAMQRLTTAAVEHGQDTIEIMTPVSDRLGSPGYPNYQWWETSVKEYTGRAIITLDLKGGRINFTYSLPEHDQHPWSGW